MREEATRRDLWVSLGMAVSALSAAVSSFSGLRSLAEVAGWHPVMAWLFPLTVDAYAMTATRVWLAASTRSLRARRFARANAIGAILMSLVGNATYHLVAAGLVAVTWPIVLGVGAVPPLVLGLVSHLAVLRTQADPVAPAEEVVRPEALPSVPPIRTSRAAVRPGSGPGPDVVGPSSAPVAANDGARHRSADELVVAACAADTRHREAHGGRPITRDALRQALRISGARATELHRRLKDEHLQQPAPSLANVIATQ
jgi:hypothetical protein